MNSIAPIVLAAGDSARMGYPKALLPLSGGYFLTVILNKLTRAGFALPVVVLGRDAGRIQPILNKTRVQVVINGNPDRGQASSIQTGLEVIGDSAEGALIWPVDLPAVPAEVAVSVAQRFLETQALISGPVFKGRKGHPVLFHKRLFRELLELGPGEPARIVVQRHLDSVESIEAADSTILTDIDTPEEYYRLTGRTLAKALEEISNGKKR